ncbi:MAG: hypothetical protein ACO390_17880 [bacterium]
MCLDSLRDTCANPSDAWLAFYFHQYTHKRIQNLLWLFQEDLRLYVFLLDVFVLQPERSVDKLGGDMQAQ